MPLNRISPPEEKVKGIRDLWRVIDIYEGGEFKRRTAVRSKKGLQILLEQAREKGWSLLDRGYFYLPEEERKKIFRGEFVSLERLVRVGVSVSGDVDEKGEDWKRFVKYLSRIGIRPEIWESPSGGWHFHLYLVWGVRKERGRVFYEFPYASDWRIKAIEELLKELLRKLGIRYDSVSAKRAFWIEGFPNPLKDGKASRLVFEGKIHRIDSVFKKLFFLIEERARKEVWAGLGKRKKKDPGGGEVPRSDHSNPAHFIQERLRDGTITRLLNAGCSLDEVREALSRAWTGDQKAFERAFSRAEEFIRSTFRPLRRKKAPAKRKHRHYWEWIDEIRKCLEEGITSLRGIHRKAGVPLSTLHEIFSLVSRDQILKNPGEVKEFLSSLAKGGARATKEKLSRGGKKAFERYLSSQIERALSRFREKPPGAPKKPLPDSKKQFILSPVFYFVKSSDRAKSITLSENGTSPKTPQNSQTLPRPQNNTHGTEENKKKTRNSEIDERTLRLVAARRLYARTWVLFRKVKGRLERAGVRVSDDRRGIEGEVDGRKLMRLIRYLVARRPLRLNLEGWGRFAGMLYVALVEEGVLERDTRVVLPSSVVCLAGKREEDRNYRLWEEDHGVEF